MAVDVGQYLRPARPFWDLRGEGLMQEQALKNAESCSEWPYTISPAGNEHQEVQIQLCEGA